jgi:hypothetical protein
MVGIERCLVRLFSGRGMVVGGGFLATPEVVLTCERVVRAALGLRGESSVEAGAAVTLDFPFLKSRPFSARVLRADAMEDIAVLRLEVDPPPTPVRPCWWTSGRPGAALSAPVASPKATPRASGPTASCAPPTPGAGSK